MAIFGVCGSNIRMVWLPDGEKNLKICLFVLSECMNVTDTQTHGHHMTAKAALGASIARQKRKTDRKSYMSFQLVTISMTLNNRNVPSYAVQ